MKLTFLGATGTVTGSKSLVEAGNTRILVDCGMFQGFKQLRLRNWERDPSVASTIDAVVLTHAHLDHCGRLPLLVRDGFEGPIHCSSATADLLRVMLLDAAHLQQEDARRANRRGYSRHRPAEPLFTAQDVERTLGLVERQAWDTPIRIGEVEVTLVPAGHMLGANGVRLAHADKSVFFSGDLGRPHDLLMQAPRPFEGADVLVVESTYGDRLHAVEDPGVTLEHIVNRVCGRGGVLMIPAFAVGRSQAVLHLLATLRSEARIPDVPVFLNSPMAIKATEIFHRHPEAHRLTPAECDAMCDVATYVRTADESKVLNTRNKPMVLVAGSGMATGGRILHHLKSFAPNPANGILLVGFQASGTRGEAIAAGAEAVKIHGEYIPVGAERFRMHGLSGHADWREIMGWLRGAEAPGRILINHGEPSAADMLRRHLAEELGWKSEVAEYRTPYDL